VAKPAEKPSIEVAPISMRLMLLI